ncbi:MAG: hypothetical protein HWE09_08320 [Cyclobacteriaceae bacterium]|nr:hypothetical protein [Cyclobacteriaceae bacterium]
MEELATEIEIISEEPDSIQAANSFTQDDQENIQRLIRLTLTDLFEEDLEKGFLDSASRRFLYDQVDLNGDGNLEILVGLTGSYFCGSGGCTIYLLSNKGDVITRFTVVDYPVHVDNESTNGWKNLVLNSGRKDRLVKYDGQKYPSNPSVLDEFSGDLSNTQSLLVWNEEKLLTF